MIELNGTPVVPTIFPDRTSQVWKLPEEALQAFSASIVWKFENEGEFMHLAQLCMLLRSRHVVYELHLPFLPYARQDKEIANDATFALRTFADLICRLDCSRVVLYDPHNAAPLREALEGYTHIEVRTFETHARAAYHACGANVWCFPDAGALKRYADSICSAGDEAIVAEKRRDQGSGAITGTFVGRPIVDAPRIMIIDDICDGGATFIALAQKLKEQGASEVFLFVSHGIFSRGLQPLFDAGISRIFTPEGEKQR